MTGGRRHDAFHHGLRISGTRLRRGERYRARRAVRLFSQFVRNCLREAGSGILSCLFDALAIPTDVARGITALAIADDIRGGYGDGLYNALSWMLLIILSDVSAHITSHVSIHRGDETGVVFISDDD